MCRQSSLKTENRKPKTITALVALLAPVLATAAPPEQEKSDARFLASAEFRAEHWAALGITAPCTPRIGPWSALAAVYAGASLDPPVWDLRGVFSTKAGRINVGAS